MPSAKAAACAPAPLTAAIRVIFSRLYRNQKLIRGIVYGLSLLNPLITAMEIVAVLTGGIVGFITTFSETKTSTGFLNRTG